jgi:hypothetical protein
MEHVRVMERVEVMMTDERKRVRNSLPPQPWKLAVVERKRRLRACPRVMQLPHSHGLVEPLVRHDEPTSGLGDGFADGFDS